ncbi:hypothetical protein AGMMS49579_17050 [Spirochaetia bacterium]|nr:hypothetical protein AGMMS49579_17050 [Spirochaetia bacterium]
MAEEKKGLGLLYHPALFDFEQHDTDQGRFFAAVVLLVYSCYGYSFVVAYSREAKNPKRDVPYAMMITAGILLVMYSAIALVAAVIAVITLPKRLPEAWDNRYFKRMSKPVFYGLMYFSLVVTLSCIVLSFNNMARSNITVTIGLVIIFLAYAILRRKSGKVQMQKSYELQ